MLTRQEAKDMRARIRELKRELLAGAYIARFLDGALLLRYQALAAELLELQERLREG